MYNYETNCSTYLAYSDAKTAHMVLLKCKLILPEWPKALLAIFCTVPVYSPGDSHETIEVQIGEIPV